MNNAAGAEVKVKKLKSLHVLSVEQLRLKSY